MEIPLALSMPQYLTLFRKNFPLYQIQISPVKKSLGLYKMKRLCLFCDPPLGHGKLQLGSLQPFPD